MKYAVLITGSRDWIDEAPIRESLARLPAGSVVIHGGARGADAIADRVARDLGLAVEVIKANWTRHGNSAGPIRNGQLVQLLCDYRRNGYRCLVRAYPLPQSRGTYDCMRKAEAAGFLVRDMGRIHES